MAMITHNEMTLGELASKSPELIPLLFQKDLDFCCGGKQRIDEACQQKGLNLQTFLAEIQEYKTHTSAGPVPTWQEDQLPALIEFILTRFHAGHRRDFEMLSPLMAKVLKAHAVRNPDLAELSRLCDALIADIEPHMQKEEQILFPLMLRLAGEEIQSGPLCTMDPSGPIRVMLMDHDQVGGLLDQMVKLTHQFSPPDWACSTYKGLLVLLDRLNQEIRLHIHLENNVLFPMALNLVQ